MTYIKSNPEYFAKLKVRCGYCQSTNIDKTTHVCKDCGTTNPNTSFVKKGKKSAVPSKNS